MLVDDIVIYLSDVYHYPESYSLSLVILKRT